MPAWGRSRAAPKPGTRLLKRGLHGPDVAWLQGELARWGYEPGPVDGRFGFLTEDALRALQKDYGLRPDGKAGREVYALLQALRPAPLRPVPEGQRRGSARDGGGRGTPEGLRGRSRARELPRWLLLHVPRGKGSGGMARRVVERYGPQGTGLIDGRFPWTDASAPSGPPPWPPGVPGWVHLSLDLTSWAGRRSRRSPARAAAAPPEVEAAVQWASQHGPFPVRGFHLERPPLPWGRGSAWARGFVNLSEYLWRYGLTVLVTVPLPDLGRPLVRLFNDLQLETWVPYAEAVIVPGPALGEPVPFDRWYARLESVRALLPPWKCIVGLDLRAVERDTAGRALRRLSHQQALATAYRHRIRPQWDAARDCSCLTYEEEGQRRCLCVWSRQALLPWLRRASLFGLAGLALGPAGSEDEGLWEQAVRHMAVARHVGPVPGIKSLEGEGGPSP